MAKKFGKNYWKAVAGLMAVTAVIEILANFPSFDFSLMHFLVSIFIPGGNDFLEVFIPGILAYLIYFGFFPWSPFKKQEKLPKIKFINLGIAIMGPEDKNSLKSLEKNLVKRILGLADQAGLKYKNRLDMRIEIVDPILDDFPNTPEPLPSNLVKERGEERFRIFLFVENLDSKTRYYRIVETNLGNKDKQSEVFEAIQPDLESILEDLTAEDPPPARWKM